MSYGTDSFGDVKSLLVMAYTYAKKTTSADSARKPNVPESSRKSDLAQVQTAVEAIALCHNVTPCFEPRPDDGDGSEAEADQFYGADTQVRFCSYSGCVSLCLDFSLATRGCKSTVLQLQRRLPEKNWGANLWY